MGHNVIIEKGGVEVARGEADTPEQALEFLRLLISELRKTGVSLFDCDIKFEKD